MKKNNIRFTVAFILLVYTAIIFSIVAFAR